MLPTILIVAWLALPALVWFALLCVRRRFHPALVCAVCFVTMIAGTVVLANYVWALDAQLLAEIDKYESGTPEAQRASEEWASDTDRSFLFLFSPVLSAFWYGVVFVSLFGLQRVVSRMFPAKNPSENSSMAIETAEERGDNGNPYHPPNVG
ncbi:MAG: hypothetical protein OSA98_19965 [Rubripirellula sp.]|nr:hypothetical protein [Rubripirellula sp.]